MFTLKQIVKLSHINVRDEKHGDDTVLAIDIKITADVPNTFLNQLSPGLREALYCADSEQADMLEDGHLPKLRHPTLEPVKLGLTMVGAKLALEANPDHPNGDLDFEVNIKAIKLECKTGGTVGITFSAATLPEAMQLGALSALLGQQITMNLYPGAVSQEIDKGSAGE